MFPTDNDRRCTMPYHTLAVFSFVEKTTLKLANPRIEGPYVKMLKFVSSQLGIATYRDNFVQCVQGCHAGASLLLSFKQAGSTPGAGVGSDLAQGS